MAICIKTYQRDDYKKLADIFYASVHAICPSIYNGTQKNAWAKRPINYDFWQDRFLRTQPFCAFIENDCVGFIEFESNGHIDCLYVHPDYQRQGIAYQLYQHIEKQAQAERLEKLFVEASLLAKPFFEKLNFCMTCKNEVERNGEVLINFSMEKYLVY